MQSTPAPPISRGLLRLFELYCRWYYPRHLHQLLVAGEDNLPRSGALVIYLNHPSWWDPLTCLHLAMRLLPEYWHYAPIDAAALGRYGFFARLGFFPVEPGTLKGARSFLRYARGIVADPRACLWVTAQGRFADVRERPVELMAGVEHLRTRAVPLALEYAFLEESKPCALARFGAPATSDFSAALTATMDRVAGDVVARNLGEYRSLLTGKVGVGGVYDFVGLLRAAIRGRRFVPDHAAATRASRTGR